MILSIFKYFNHIFYIKVQGRRPDHFFLPKMVLAVPFLGVIMINFCRVIFLGIVIDLKMNFIFCLNVVYIGN